MLLVWVSIQIFLRSIETYACVGEGHCLQAHYRKEGHTFPGISIPECNKYKLAGAIYVQSTLFSGYSQYHINGLENFCGRIH